MVVTVTQDDMIGAVRCSPTCCILAQALKRTTGQTDVSVTSCIIVNNELYPLTVEVYDVMRRFDENRQLHLPLTLELKR